MKGVGTFTQNKVYASSDLYKTKPGNFELNVELENNLFQKWFAKIPNHFTLAVRER